MIDLHLHSTESDGSLDPAELVRRASAAGLTAIALTDHDTMAGLPAATAAGGEFGLEVVPGVEVSIDHRPGTFHLIGLFPDARDPALADALDRVREGRARRNERIAAKLTGLEFPLTVAEVAAFSGGGLVARPHFAKAMVVRGYVRSVKAAFDFWIGKGRPAYAERFRLGAKAAIDLLHGAGGVAVLCHPHTLGMGDDIEAFVADLASLGLDAIETKYKERDPVREKGLGGIARRLGLLHSGGSDYHGHTLADQRNGLGAIGLEPEALEALRERAAARRREHLL